MLFPNLEKLFDSHAHVSDSLYSKDIDSVVMSAEQSSVNAILDVAVDIESSKRSIYLSQTYPGRVFSFVGIDPEVFIPQSPFFIGFDKDQTWFEEQYNILTELITQNKEFIIGIGESGMDYHHNQFNYEGDRISHEDLENSNELQERLFKLQLELAQKFKLPMTIHSRKAENKCLEIVSEYDVSGIFHSFTGNYSEAVKILDKGWGLGVNGIITFKKAEELREVYKKILGKVDIDTEAEFFYEKGIYFETDSPFLSPEGKRGERNTPANVKIVYDNFKKIVANAL